MQNRATDIADHILPLGDLLNVGGDLQPCDGGVGWFGALEFRRVFPLDWIAFMINLRISFYEGRRSIIQSIKKSINQTINQPTNLAVGVCVTLANPLLASILAPPTEIKIFKSGLMSFKVFNRFNKSSSFFARAVAFKSLSVE